ncbi:MAG TPA: V-type ATP synthase subunit C [Methanobacteriaceae archaeon]|nr:V-type ATP synthase subunit C [Methanobacteriaceae archaeon]
MADISTIITSLGFPSMESFLGVLFLVLAVVGAIVVVATIKPVLDMFPYAYSNARVRARMGRLFNDKQLSEIVEAQDLEEVKNYLRGTPEYAQYVDKYTLEKALDTQLAETYDLIARISPDAIKDAFKVLMKKWDIQNIKSLITAKEAGLNTEETLDLLVPFGELSDELEKLVDAKNITEVITGLEGTEYSPVLEDATSDYEKTGMLLPLEAALDKYYLKNLLRTVATPEDDNTRLLHSYIGTQVDAENLKIIMRAKQDGLKYQDIEPYMITTGYQLREWKLKDLMESDDVAGVVGGLEGTEYAQILSEALSEYQKTGSIASLETALDKNLLKMAKSISLKNPFGIGPLIGFLSRKEKEVRNLKVIARGKRESGFPVSQLKEMLI